MEFIQIASNSENNTWDTIKTMILTMFTWIISIISPLSSILFILLVVFIMNIFGGVITIGIKDPTEVFSLKKFAQAFLLFLLFGTSIIFTHYLGVTFKDALVSDSGVKWLSYIIIWGYALNIFKNAKLKWPDNRSIATIYNILSVQVYNTIKSQFDKKTKN